MWAEIWELLAGSGDLSEGVWERLVRLGDVPVLPNVQPVTDVR